MFLRHDLLNVSVKNTPSSNTGGGGEGRMEGMEGSQLKGRIEEIQFCL